MKHFASIVCLVLVSCGKPTSSNDSPPSPKSFSLFNSVKKSGERKFVEEALTRSHEEKKPAIVFVSAAWCLPCNLMEQQIATDAELSTTLREKFVTVHVEEAFFVGSRLYDFVPYTVTGYPSVYVYMPSVSKWHMIGGVNKFRLKEIVSEILLDKDLSSKAIEANLSQLLDAKANFNRSPDNGWANYLVLSHALLMAGIENSTEQVLQLVHRVEEYKAANPGLLAISINSLISTALLKNIEVDSLTLDKALTQYKKYLMEVEEQPTADELRKMLSAELVRNLKVKGDTAIQPLCQKIIADYFGPFLKAAPQAGALLKFDCAIDEVNGGQLDAAVGQDVINGLETSFADASKEIFRLNLISKMQLAMKDLKAAAATREKFKAAYLMSLEEDYAKLKETANTPNDFEALEITKRSIAKVRNVNQFLIDALNAGSEEPSTLFYNQHK